MPQHRRDRPLQQSPPSAKRTLCPQHRGDRHAWGDGERVLTRLSSVAAIAMHGGIVGGCWGWGGAFRASDAKADRLGTE